MQKYRDTTRCTYHHIRKLFNQFFLRLDIKPCSWEDCLVLFTRFLVKNKLKSSTAKKYLSAIRSVLLELGEKISTDNYLIKALTKVCHLHNDTVINKLPISKGVLKLLIDSIGHLFSTQPYLCKLYTAVFASAYYGLLRIAEVTQIQHALLARNVHIGLNKRKILFIFLTSKTHTKGDKPQQVKICSSNSGQRITNAYYPFVILCRFIESRPMMANKNEQFFIYSNHTPLRQTQLQKILVRALKDVGLDSKAYSFHGLHAGRSSDLLKMGISVETIKKLGRWKSNVVFTYLRN